MSETLETTIKRVGKKYMEAPKDLRITVGQILEGVIKINIKEVKANE